MSKEDRSSKAPKRKAGDTGQLSNYNMRKRQKTEAMRTIPTQTRDAALSATGELDVAAFVKARQFEINALETSMQTARKGLASRAFQQVPRHMRRRTASHNVKKVPRRLRRRAEREMKEHNTPTVTSRRRTPSGPLRLRLETAKRIKSLNAKFKSARARKKEAKLRAAGTDPEKLVMVTEIPKIKKNQLSDPPKASSKFKKRQVQKTWLPTHLWHAKRAHMTRPTEPLWRMAIPLSPTEKSYRPSHRVSGGRGAIVWDTSYISTIGCRGSEASLTAMLRAVGLRNEQQTAASQKRWMNGTRSADAWVCRSDGDKSIICPVRIIWEAQKNQDKGQDNDVQMTDAPVSLQGNKPMKRQLFIRVHPSAFHQLWTELLKTSKAQQPPVMIEDLRFELASIEVIGPSSTEALNAVLLPTASSESAEPGPAQTWKMLAGLTNPASLPANALLCFNVGDPRLHNPRKSIEIPQSGQDEDDMTDLTINWPVDKTQSKTDIFSHQARYTAAKRIPSQKAIDRRKGQSEPGRFPKPSKTDPAIPIMLLASRAPTSANSAQGKWTLILPWKCLDSIWRCLMYYPLNSGRTARFGGLNQTRQIAAERHELWFPGDFPGTEAGKAWARSEAENRRLLWERKPPGRRVSFDALKLDTQRKGEHGKAFECDWEFLFGSEGQVSKRENITDKLDKETAGTTSTTTADKKSKPGEPPTQKEENAKIADEDADSSAKATPTPTFTHLSPLRAQSILRYNPSKPLNLPPSPIATLATIRLTLLARGTPSPCARIYHLPSNPDLRSSWLLLLPPTQNSTHNQRKPRVNWRGDLNNPSAYPDDHADIEKINYLPPDIGAEGLAELKKRREKAARKREKWLAGRREVVQKEERGKNGKGKPGEEGDGEQLDDDNATATATAITAKHLAEQAAQTALLKDLMTPCADRDRDSTLNPPCPPASDLIGFVTSGGFNLAEGKGVAVGAIWVGRVLDGWRKEREGEGKNGVRGGDSERLCIVRNVGEAVGRLARWDVGE